MTWIPGYVVYNHGDSFSTSPKDLVGRVMNGGRFTASTNQGNPK